MLPKRHARNVSLPDLFLQVVHKKGFSPAFADNLVALFDATCHNVPNSFAIEGQHESKLLYL